MERIKSQRGQDIRTLEKGKNILKYQQLAFERAIRNHLPPPAKRTHDAANGLAERSGERRSPEASSLKTPRVRSVSVTIGGGNSPTTHMTHGTTLGYFLIPTDDMLSISSSWWMREPYPARGMTLTVAERAPWAIIQLRCWLSQYFAR